VPNGGVDLIHVRLEQWVNLSFLSISDKLFSQFGENGVILSIKGGSEHRPSGWDAARVVVESGLVGEVDEQPGQPVHVTLVLRHQSLANVFLPADVIIVVGSIHCSVE